MIRAKQIASLRGKSEDTQAARDLEEHFRRLRAKRPEVFLTPEDLDQVLRWKLRGQYGRQERLRLANTPEIIEAVTRLALNIDHIDPDYRDELRVHTLCALRGVGIPVASAILAVVYPEEYAVIDFRGWRQVFDEPRSAFTIGDYLRYLAHVRRLAKQLGWPVREVDEAIWEFDRRQDGSR